MRPRVHVDKSVCVSFAHAVCDPTELDGRSVCEIVQLSGETAEEARVLKPSRDTCAHVECVCACVHASTAHRLASILTRLDRETAGIPTGSGQFRVRT